jgi:hypothetical protein
MNIIEWSYVNAYLEKVMSLSDMLHHQDAVDVYKFET